MSEKIATREAYGQTLAELAATDKNLVVLDADLSKSTKTCDFAKVCPERFVDVGIAEQNMVSISAGLATLGKHVFCSSFAIFAVGRAFEQIRNSIAYPQLPVTIAATHAGLTVGEDGATHQAIEDVAIMRAVPNMTVIVPADATETAQAVRLLAEHPGPAYLRLGRLAVEQVLPADYQFQIGKGTVLYNGDGEPEQVVIFACGLMLAKRWSRPAPWTQRALKPPWLICQPLNRWILNWFVRWPNAAAQPSPWKSTASSAAWAAQWRKRWQKIAPFLCCALVWRTNSASPANRTNCWLITA